MTWSAPSDSTQDFVSSREAVAITVRFVFAFRSWIAIDPTPPAPPIIKILPTSVSEIWNRSNSISHAVIAVNGNAAASALDTVIGLRLIIRSSTAWYSALLPSRVKSPAYQTESPTLNEVTFEPTSIISPTASQPKIRLFASDEFFLTLVSTGFTEIAWTFTSTSRSLSVGFAFSISTNEFLKSSWLLITYDTAFIDLSLTLKNIGRVEHSNIRTADR